MRPRAPTVETLVKPLGTVTAGSEIARWRWASSGYVSLSLVCCSLFGVLGFQMEGLEGKGRRDKDPSGHGRTPLEGIKHVSAQGRTQETLARGEAEWGTEGGASYLA